MEKALQSKRSILFICLARAPAGEDPQVTRAKYFIRDEFLVSPFHSSSVTRFHFHLFSESAQRPVVLVIPAIHILLVL